MNKDNQSQSFINEQAKSGKSAAEITELLVNNGWDRNAATTEVNNVLNVPQPQNPVPVTQTAQTGASGTPMQVENVQYNMNVKPVESKVGVYIRIASIGLVVGVLTVVYLINSLIAKQISSEDIDLGVVFVLSISLLAVAIPTYYISNSKLSKELAGNSALYDDLFLKKTVRRSLVGSVILTAMSLFFTLFTFISLMFLEGSNLELEDAYGWLLYSLGFGAILAYFWRLHKRTKR